MSLEGRQELKGAQVMPVEKELFVYEHEITLKRDCSCFRINIE